MIRRHLALLVLCFAAAAAHAAPIASSTSDFSNVQGQDGWFYGYFNQGTSGATPYTTGAFTNFATFDLVSPDSWGASDVQVGAQNNDYLALGRNNGHPTGLAPPDIQDSIIWAVRRYVSEVAGDITIRINLRKENTNPNGGGITGRVFVDGTEIYTQFVAGTDGTGYQATRVLNVEIGDFIDFAIDPLGLAINSDGIYSPRADGTFFTAVILPGAVPIAPTFWLMIAGLAGLGASRRYRAA